MQFNSPFASAQLKYPLREAGVWQAVSAGYLAIVNKQSNSMLDLMRQMLCIQVPKVFLAKREENVGLHYHSR